MERSVAASRGVAAGRAASGERRPVRLRKGQVGAVYYVDASGGNDANAGTAAAAAWQTLARVKQQALRPGDAVLLRRGSTWTGETLNLTASGLDGRPIVFGAYGDGPAPVIDGGDAQNCIFLQHVRGLWFEGLALRNGLDFCAWVQDCAQIMFVGCSGTRAGNDVLNFFGASRDCAVIGGRWSGAYPRMAGPAPSGIECADGATGIDLERVECSGNDGAGITIHSHATPAPTPMPRGIRLREVVCRANTAQGLIVFNQNPEAGAGAALDVTVERGRFEGNSLEGVKVTKAAGIGEYPAGVELTDCELLSNGTYNAWIEGDDVTLRRVLSVGGRGIYVRDGRNVLVDRATCYLATYGGFRAINLNSNAGRLDGVTVRNGIVQIDEPTVASFFIGTEAGATANVSIDRMLYFAKTASVARGLWNGATVNMAAGLATWQAASGQDANSPPMADPLFASAANGVFRPRAGSPAAALGLGYMEVI